jgi:hypothetical protein
VSLRRAFTLCLLPFFGCTLAGLSRESPVECQNDSDCPAAQVCYADGCGGALTGLIVEVTPSPNGGGQPQDIPLSSVEGTQMLQLAVPATINGAVTQPPMVGLPALPYPDPVVMQVNGTSALIPNRVRSFQQPLMLAGSYGNYSMQMPTGIYTLTVLPSDPGIPPQTFHGIQVDSGDALQQAVLFPAYDDPSLLVLQSGLNVPGDGGFKVQAFDAMSGDPLSQAVPATVQGGFTLVVDGEARDAGGFNVNFSPVDPSSAPFATVFVTVEDGGVVYPNGDTVYPFSLGNYGTPFATTGTALGPDGQPVSGAAVSVSGPVIGGGNFQSPTAITGPDGTFSLQTLTAAGASEVTAFLLSIVPLPGSAAGAQQFPISPSPEKPQLGSFTCPSRVTVSGSVTTPDGGTASTTSISAVVIGTLTTTPLPASTPQATTDALGNFSLPLDPALYRLDFTPSDPSLPNISRALDLRADAAGAAVSLQFQLSNGHTLSGSVVAPTSAADPTLVASPNAVIRFFRVNSVGPTTADLVVSPLATTDSDANGNYSVVLPTR